MVQNLERWNYRIFCVLKRGPRDGMAMEAAIISSWRFSDDG
jgi:hypothetical protein